MEKVHKTNAMRLLDTRGIDYQVISYEHKKDDPVDGISVAAALNEPVEKVYKTLVCQANTREHFVFMIPVDQELDFKKCARAAGVKNMELIPLKTLTPLTGYVRGGCSPLGMKKPFRTFIDENVILQEDIYFSAGRIGMQIHMDPNQLMDLLDIQAFDLVKS